MGTWWILKNGEPVIRCKNEDQAVFGVQLLKLAAPLVEWDCDFLTCNGVPL